MNYYSSSAYGERYYFRFTDIEGTPWRVSIQQPNYTGGRIELTASENPIEWMGTGDESQDEVVLGSTGTMRLLCLPMQERVFLQGNLLPQEINDRKVVVTRRRWSVDQYVWDIIWQGFIKPEQYTQEWGSNFVLYEQNPTLGRVATEVDLPIVSIIAATEFFPMPAYDDMEEKGYIADLLWYAISLIGGNYTNILTNKWIYEDFNGEMQYTGNVPNHWTEGKASTMYFYDFEGDGVKPKTIKELFETICYPYGKLYEYQTSLCIIMSAGKYVSGDASLWELTDDSRKFGLYAPIKEVSLSDIQTKGTDNKFSLVSKPSSVEFSNDLDIEIDVFDTTENFIKPTLPCDVSTITSASVYKKTFADSSLAVDRYHYHFTDEYINTSLCKPAEDYGITGPTRFCRVVEVSTTDSTKYTYALFMPLAFWVPKGGTYLFEIPFKVKSVPGKNKVKVSFDIYADDAYAKLGNGLYQSEGLSAKIIDVDEGVYLDPTHSWTALPQSFPLSVNDWPVISSVSWPGLNVTFNEQRVNDTSGKPHTLRIALAQRDYIGNPPQFDMYCKIKIEYVRDDTYTLNGVADTFASTIQNEGMETNLGGSGESLHIDMKTLCGRASSIINGAAYMPYNGFCDAQTYIDTGNRKKIEIQEAAFNVDLIAEPFIVNDDVSGNGDVYVPVAIGMSPRDCQVQLRLVSTNIGLTQPTQE